MVERFEELIAWKKTRLLAVAIYRLTRQGAFVTDRGLSTQVQRAAVSIISNIAEGFERSSPVEFRQFLAIAKASCAELRSQLYLALDVNYVDQQQFDQLFAQAEEVARLINGRRASIERRQPHPRR